MAPAVRRVHIDDGHADEGSGFLASGKLAARRGCDRGAAQFFAASTSAKSIAERCQPLAGGEEHSDDTPGYRGPAPRPRQGSQIRRPGRGLAPLAGCLSPRLSPGVSLSLNPRLMAGKPPACKVDATSPQETQLHPRDWKRRAYVAQTGSLLPCRRRVAGQGVGDPFALETSTPCGLPTRDTADRQLRYECPLLRIAPFFRPDVGGCRRM